MRHKHRVRQIIINYLLSFILMLSIVTAVVMAVGKVTFLSESAIQHASDKTHYYYNLKNEMETKAMDFAVPFGIQKECLKGVFQESEVKQDVIKTFKEKLDKTKAMIDIGEIDRRIRANVEKKEGKLNAAQAKSLNAYIKRVQDMYMNKLHYPTENFMANLINSTTSFAWISIPLSIVIGIFCAFYLIVSRHYAYHGIRYVVYAVMGAGALLTVGFSAIISNGSIYNYNVTDSYLKEWYVYWVGHPLLLYVIFGIAILLLSLIGIFIVYRQKYAVRR